MIVFYAKGGEVLEVLFLWLCTAEKTVIHLAEVLDFDVLEFEVVRRFGNHRGDADEIDCKQGGLQASS
jgi:hypothetical protein